MIVALPQETEQAYRHVLWYFNEPGGYQPGGFTTALLEAISRADSTNINRLSSAFPTLVYVFRLIRDHPDGAEYVRSMLKLEEQGKHNNG